MLRKIRITIAVTVMTLITLLLLDFSGTLHPYLGWLANIQLVPAILAVNVVVIVGLAVLTLVFGRIYCSVICPLGMLQDLVSWLHERFGGKKAKRRFNYSPAKWWLRYLMLGAMTAAMMVGIHAVIALLAPYSAYGRIATNLLQPLYIMGNNALAAIAEHYESYAFYHVDVWVKMGATFAVAVATLLVVGWLAWRHGRTYCNTICPVGTVLGVLARFSWFKVYIDLDKCRTCGACSHRCKASCIDSKNHAIDYTRCVTCGNCLPSCEFGALRYGHPRAAAQPAAAEQPAAASTEQPSRRAFLVGSAIVAADAALAQAGKKVDGGLAAIEKKVAPPHRATVTPPGSLSVKHMAKYCTSCQLCVAQCPNQVLRPSNDLATLMMPTMSFERGFCRPECTRCSQVCPTDAIRPITVEEKTDIHVGYPVWLEQNCLPVTRHVACGNCARHCPTGAIEMMPLDENDELSPMVPNINEARCIGCGACEYVCPSRPFSAIYVEGYEVHN